MPQISDSESDNESPSRVRSRSDAQSPDASPRRSNTPDSENRPPKQPTPLQGYQQIYLIRKPDPNSSDIYSGERTVLFRCGNWCYQGKVTLDYGHKSSDDDDDSNDSDGTETRMSLRDIPRLIPLLQRQQSKLAFFCNSNAIPQTSPFLKPLQYAQEAQDFIAEQLISQEVNDVMERMEKMYTWMDDDNTKSYFELTADKSNDNTRDIMDDIQCICSKTYARGLVFITMYFEDTFYVSVSDGSGDQPLLDVRFPDVSNQGEGVMLRDYGDSPKEGMGMWTKLTLWQSLAADVKLQQIIKPKTMKTKNLSSEAYIQSYCVLKNKGGDGGSEQGSFRTALFRFGSWCYSGRVQLTPKIALVDLPHVIPALRMQQSRLEFLCDVSQMPGRSPFVKPLEFAMKIAPVMESEVVNAEGVLNNLVERLSSMGLGDSISQWLEGDPTDSFFEFQFADDKESQAAHKDVEIMCSKCYDPNGIVTISIYFEGTYYLTLLEGGGEQPLLDSKFPNVSGKGRGYQIRAYDNGVDGWKSLRKVSVWQTSAAMQKEMEGRISQSTLDVVGPAIRQLHGTSNTNDLFQAGEDKATGGASFGDAIAIAEARNAKLVEEELAAGGDVITNFDEPAQAKDAPETEREEAEGDQNRNVNAESKADPDDTLTSSVEPNTSATAETTISKSMEVAVTTGTTEQPAQNDTVIGDESKEIADTDRGRSKERKEKKKKKKKENEGSGSGSNQQDAKDSSSGDRVLSEGQTATRKQSLGAFHHLAPMRKTSALESQLGAISSSMGKDLDGGGLKSGLGKNLSSGGALGGSAPWDPFGRPVLGQPKKEAKD